MDDSDTGELRAAVARACGLAPGSGVATDRQSLLDELARRVDHLLRHDAEKLMYYLYALDVSEDVIGRAFEPGATESPARFIAQAILDREATRIRTRKQYERQKSDMPRDRGEFGPADDPA